MVLFITSCCVGSCYGKVTSLNGEPEPGVVVEAVGEGPDCQQYQEEAKTEQDGSYRIRGLKVCLPTPHHLPPLSLSLCPLHVTCRHVSLISCISPVLPPCYQQPTDVSLYPPPQPKGSLICLMSPPIWNLRAVI